VVVRAMSGQCRDGILLWATQKRAAVLQEFESIEHFKDELVEYLDYYNNRRIMEKIKGFPPVIQRQQALLSA
jgi:hypothetical protein